MTLEFRTSDTLGKSSSKELRLSQLLFVPLKGGMKQTELLKSGFPSFLGHLSQPELPAFSVLWELVLPNILSGDTESDSAGFPAPTTTLSQGGVHVM